jgi:CRP-like cAMP-binding protein
MRKGGISLIHKNWHNILQKVSLFEGINEEGMDSILQCVGGSVKDIKKGEFALLTGDKVMEIGIVLSGELHLFSECFDGKRSLITSLLPSDTYGESLCCAHIGESPVSVMAKVDSVVMMLDFSRALQLCPDTCGFHRKLIENMLRVVASSNLHLQKRMEILSMNSVRGKVLQYLGSFVQKQGNNITIPFNREELANYLCVERSALSHELARMKTDNLIDYKKNKFHLKTSSLSNLPSYCNGTIKTNKTSGKPIQL